MSIGHLITKWIWNWREFRVALGDLETSPNFRRRLRATFRTGGLQTPVPTATFRILYVFVVLSHDRRHIVHFNVTAHPTAQWTAQQLLEAFPFEKAPRYLLRDRDAIYGDMVQRRIKSLGIEEVVTAPRSPWQNPFCERVIGSIRRDCLDHVIILNERHLRRILREYISYYHNCRTHLSLNKDSPNTRPVEPSAMGDIVAFPHVGGLHHRYGRIAA